MLVYVGRDDDVFDAASCMAGDCCLEFITKITEESSLKLQCVNYIFHLDVGLL